MPIRINSILLASLACIVVGGPTWPVLVPDAHVAARGLAAQAPSPDRVPGGWSTTVVQQIQQSEYEITREERGAAFERPAGVRDAPAGVWQAPNRSHNYRSYFTPDGIRLVPRTLGADGIGADRTASTWTWGLTPVAYGGVPVSPAKLIVSGPRAEYRRSGMTQWYVNDVKGIEGGFTLAAPPLRSPAGARAPVTLELAVSGDLSAKLSPDGRGFDFITPAGVPVVRYDGLRVLGASGRDLQATVAFNVSSMVVRFVAVEVDFPVGIFLRAGRPDWSAEAASDGARFGYQVATAGNVNGDEYADVIVGAPFYDSGQVDEGKVWVYHGSPSGLGHSAAFSKEGHQTGARFGNGASTAGDVNGDGFDDVIFGAPGYDNGHVDEGTVWVYHGSASGLSQNPSFSADIDQTYALYGFSVATAGDVNGDGYADVIVGAPLHDNGTVDEGSAFVYHGSPSGLGSYTHFAGNSNQAGAAYGIAVATAGDVNDDGFDDVIVGAPFHDSGHDNEGIVYVYFGSPFGTESLAAFTAQGNQAGAWFGWSVSTAGDINGDGYADVIVGAPAYDNGEPSEGQVWVFRGSASGFSSIVIEMDGDQPGALYGLSVAAAGDVNGDGYGDVAIGAAGYTNGVEHEGQVWVHRGTPSGLAPFSFYAVGGQAEAFYGNSVATAGDVNGDGYDDLIVGAPLYDNGSQEDAGRVEVFHGPM